MVIGATAVQTALGFGSMLVCVTFGSLMWTVPELTAMLVPLSMIQTSFVVARHHRDVDTRLLFLRILPWMGVGMALCFAVVGGTAQPWMKPVLGAMVLVLAVRELLGAWRGRDADPPVRSRVASTVGLVVAGFVHALFATGGPPLVWALGQEDLDKARFRTTLTAVWVGVNSALVVAFVGREQITIDTLTATGLLLVPVGIGIGIGEWLHDRVAEGPFRTWMWGLLALGALPLLVG